MPSIKIRFSSVVKKIHKEPLDFEFLCNYVREAFKISISSYRLVCTKPVSLQIQRQADLDSINGYSAIELELIHNDDSLYSEIIRELLDIPSNRNIVLNRFTEIIRQFPSTSLDALIPSKLEMAIKEKLSDIYREASAKAEKKSPFRLVYINEGGKQVLRGLPNSQWINYSTTNFDDLSKSLPPNVIEKLKNK